MASVRSPAVAIELVAEDVAKQRGGNFGVRFGLEGDALAQQFLLELSEVFDDAVVNHRQLARRRRGAGGRYGRWVRRAWPNGYGRCRSGTPERGLLPVHAIRLLSLPDFLRDEMVPSATTATPAES